MIRLLFVFTRRIFSYFLLDFRPGPTDLSCLDVFSASGKVMDAFVKQHCRAAKYDILSGGANEDLSSREGFHTLLLKGLRLMTFALVMCGPPCSLFIFLSSSQHLRHLYGAMGSPWDVPTQLANIIAGNMACFLHIIKIARKPWIVVEQPKGSWLLKLPRVLDLISTCKFMRVSTYMCFWDLRRFVSICFEIQILLYFGFFCMITMITMSVAV